MLCWRTWWPYHQQMHTWNQIGWWVRRPIQGWMMSGGFAYWLQLSKLGLSYRPWVDHDAHPQLGQSFQLARTLKYECRKGPTPYGWTRWCRAWPTEQATLATHLNRGVYSRSPVRPWRIGGRQPVPSQTCQFPWRRVLDWQHLAFCNIPEGTTFGPWCQQRLSRHWCTITRNWHSHLLLRYRPPWAFQSSQCWTLL